MGIRINKIISIPGRSILTKDAVIKHYLSLDAGKWLYRAGNVEFKKPVEPIKWLLYNKPKYEVHSPNFLVSCLGVINKYVENNAKLIHIFASAYEYIDKMGTPRRELCKAFLSLTSEGKKAEEIEPHMMKKRMKLSDFTFQKDNKRRVQDGELEGIINDDNRLNKSRIGDGYLKMIIIVYLHLNEYFTHQ